ncbi:diguanylate cyclase [Microbulbifer elongatus]|uniref:diguanylate cyclase n=1 Tax=Microbulbifer elongatus TaxID=86173 RepID=UPI001E390A5F|nr:diguanylate cyclase [Microbulbifer elongatus]
MKLIGALIHCMRIGLLCAPWLFAPSVARADIVDAAPPVVEVAPGQSVLSLTPYLQLFVDHDHALSADAPNPAALAHRLTPLNREAANFGFSDAAYWVAFTLRNPTDRDLPLVIRQDYPLMDHLDFWAPAVEGGWHHVRTGDHQPFDSRPLALRDYVFPITLPPQSLQTYYLRFASAGSINIGLSVSSQQAYLPRLGLEQLLYGIYYGGFLVLVLYNLFLFLALRDTAYAFYMGYSICCGLFFAVLNGFAFQFFWPDFPWLANRALLLALGLTLTFAIQFARLICNVKRLAPRVDRFCGLLRYGTITLTVLAPFVDYATMTEIFSAAALIVSLTSLSVGAVSVWRGSVSARYFLIAWITLMWTVVMYVFKTFGLLPHNAITHNAFQVGALIEMVLLSLALGARVGEIQRQGHTDQLTGLFNRRHFDELLAKEFSQATRNETPLSLVVLDLDHFKAINDRLGHARGDEALRAVGHLASRLVRKPAVACRYGGEEFAVLLPGCDKPVATKIADRLLNAVAKMDCDGVPLSVSIGVASYENGNFTSAIQLFEAADSALYMAKEGGRNKVVTSPDGETSSQLAASLF